MSEPEVWVVTCEHCEYRYVASTVSEADDQLEEHWRITNHWVRSSRASDSN